MVKTTLFLSLLFFALKGQKFQSFLGFHGVLSHLPSPTTLAFFLEAVVPPHYLQLWTFPFLPIKKNSASAPQKTLWLRIFLRFNCEPNDSQNNFPFCCCFGLLPFNWVRKKDPKIKLWAERALKSFVLLFENFFLFQEYYAQAKQLWNYLLNIVKLLNAAAAHLKPWSVAAQILYLWQCFCICICVSG